MFSRESDSTTRKKEAGAPKARKVTAIAAEGKEGTNSDASQREARPKTEKFQAGGTVTEKETVLHFSRGFWATADGGEGGRRGLPPSLPFFRRSFHHSRVCRCGICRLSPQFWRRHPSSVRRSVLFIHLKVDLASTRSRVARRPLSGRARGGGKGGGSRPRVQVQSSSLPCQRFL